MSTAITARAALPTDTDGDELLEAPALDVHAPAAQATLTLGVPVVSSQARPVPAIPVPVAAPTTFLVPDRSADPAGSISTAAGHPIEASPEAPGRSVVPERSPGRERGGEADEGFAPGVSAKLRSYVYLLVDPRTGRAFCVGRGRGDRCFDHVRAARLGSDGIAEVAGNPPGYPMLERIREVESDGRPVRIDILRYGLSSEEALLVEAVAGDALGLACGPDVVSRRRPVTEVRSLLAKRAKFKRGHQVVLLRVGGTGADPPQLAHRTAVDRPRLPALAAVGRHRRRRSGRRRLSDRRVGDDRRPAGARPRFGQSGRYRAHGGPLLLHRDAGRRDRTALRGEECRRLSGCGGAESRDLRVVRAPLGEHRPLSSLARQVRYPRGPWISR